jgi:hypothetical protein
MARALEQSASRSTEGGAPAPPCLRATPTSAVTVEIPWLRRVQAPVGPTGGRRLPHRHPPRGAPLVVDVTSGERSGSARAGTRMGRPGFRWTRRQDSTGRHGQQQQQWNQIRRVPNASLPRICWRRVSCSRQPDARADGGVGGGRGGAVLQPSQSSIIASIIARIDDLILRASISYEFGKMCERGTAE